MTEFDHAKLDFEDHAARLRRALGSGGAPIDLERARLELAATEAALEALRTLLGAEG